MSKISLAMRGTAALLQTPPKQKGAHPLSGNPLLYHFDEEAVPKK
jgi:hypothetical protein